MRLCPNNQPNEPIAVVGIGLRFPGATNTPAKLWDLLREPRDVQTTIPADRFNADGFYHSEHNHQETSYTRHGYFLNENHRHFDAEFFGIKPVEANSMDPQQRLLLEVIYEGIEAAGLSIKDLRGSSTAVYVGLMGADYSDMLNRDTSDYPSYVAAGTARSMMSNRVSYFFDWRGPSMTIDTACSSSLVAVHQAVQSLRLGESRIAVAAGANLILSPEQFIVGSSMNMLSPDGRSYMWDSRANGYARGEGIAAVVLKTLSAAIADGNDIECVIAETGLNQDGRTKGLTVPSATAQATLIETTYKRAGLDLTKFSDRPQYFEAHGTGTPIGDPIEAQAIQNAFFKNTDGSNHAGDHLFCGSIKTIIGHTEGTAGLAGLIKASLALRHGIIPPNLLFENLAPTVKPFYDNLEITSVAKPWPALAPGSVRRASVNSFGFGGANAHCILESYCPVKSKHITTPILHIPFVFSATSEKSLSAVLTSYLQYLESEPLTNLQALSHTLCTRRTAFSFRVAFSANSVEDLRTRLESFLQGSGTKLTLALPTRSSPLRILGVFTGQGAQWAGMARRLMQFPAAIQIIDDLEKSLADLQDPPSWSLKAELSADISSSRITEAAIAQPACTAVQILLVGMLRAAGIHFSAVVGHSSGEIAAAFAADRLSAKDAIRIAYYRGVHLPLVGGRNGETGAMIAVGASYEEAQDICSLDQFRGKICVAASNSASSVTLSGDVTAIKDVEDMFHAKKRFARLLRVDNAYHSHHMMRCSEAITVSLRACRIASYLPSRSKCVWVSSVYGRDSALVADDLESLYWHNNTVNPVLFSQALDYALRQSDFDLAVEVGAHPALKGPALQVIESVLGHVIPYTGMLNRNVDDVEAFSNGLGYIWASLSDEIVDFTGYERFLNASDPPKVLKELPKYPWDHERAFWHESRISHTFRHRSGHHELLGTRNPNYSGDQMSWKNYLVPNELSWVSGHRIQGQMVFPGSGYITSALEAAREAVAKQSVQLIELTNFTFGQPLIFSSEDSRVEVLISLTGMQRHESTLTANFTYHSITNKESGPMSLNANGQLNIVFDSDAGALQKYPERHFGMIEVDHERIYESFACCGYHYSGSFKALHSVERKPGIASGLVQIAEKTAATRLLIHPATLDAAIHSIAVAHSYPGDGRLTSVLLPTDVSKISINPYQALSSSCDQHLRFTSFSRDDAKRAEGDVDLYSADGSNAILRLEGLHTKPMVPATSANDFHMFSETVWGPAFPVLKNTLEGCNATHPYAGEEFQIMAAIARQVGHRYPAMNVLEIGARAIDVTKLFPTELDDTFASYTYTDVSDEGLNRARTVFEPHDDKLIYKTLNIENNVVDQGYAEHSFDLVVVFWINLDMSKFDRTLKTIRQLIKPGGYLLSAHVIDIKQATPDMSPMMTADSYYNKDRERAALPLIEFLEQTRMLEDYGFADTDTLVGKVSPDPPRHHITLLQAVDDRIRFLREPLASTVDHSRFSDVTLVGGATSITSACVSNLMNIMQVYSSGISQVDTLLDLLDANLSFGGNALLLQDYDKPLFEDLCDETLRGLQKLFARSKNVLWVTHGYKRNSPCARMLVAFVRCLLQEMPHVRLQILDLPSPDVLSATMISENLLRLLITGKWEDEGRLTYMLWSIEPELSYESGQYLVPRVKPSKSRNNRYNSGRRPITLPVNPREVPVTISIEDNTYTIRAKDENGSAKALNQTDNVTVRVTHSVLKAVRVGRGGFFYLVLGIDNKNHEQVIALSSTLSSVVDVPKSLVRACSLPQLKAVEQLRVLFCSLISYTFLLDLAPGESLLVLEPQRDVAAVLATFAAAQDIQAKFFTAAAHVVDDRSTWAQMHSHASKREVTAALPKGTLSRVVCWIENDWTSNICKKLLTGAPIDRSGVYMAVQGSPASPRAVSAAASVFNRLQDQSTFINAKVEFREGNTVMLMNVHGSNLDINALTVVDWTTTSSVPMRVEPADQRTLFCRDKTYWLVGLTGGLGLSLCQWMISRGATHITLSSRNPRIDPQWLTLFESLGATVKVYSCDITDRDSVKSTYDRIRTDMTPIAGVCHGAMVLQDALFQDLDMSQVEKVLKPKVDGAVHLDEIFQHHELDFFVMLSSIAAITGNPGQAVYAAANGFLAALTAQRRARGISASCVALGAILGNGYATRGLTLAQQKSLQKAGVMWTSEQDFHTAFAEAVMASSPDSQSSGEFITGVRVCYADEEYKPKHASSPIFAHLLLQRNVSEQLPVANVPGISVRAQLLQATDPKAVLQILECFMSSMLRKALQMSPDAAVIDQTADTLGIDSLIAVEMRSWLMKDLSVDMPILVIIGGSTMRVVVAKVLELLDPSMTPSLGLKSKVDKEGKPAGTEDSRSKSLVERPVTCATSLYLPSVQISRTETGAAALKSSSSSPTSPGSERMNAAVHTKAPETLAQLTPGCTAGKEMCRSNTPPGTYASATIMNDHVMPATLPVTSSLENPSLENGQVQEAKASTTASRSEVQRNDSMAQDNPKNGVINVSSVPDASSLSRFTRLRRGLLTRILPSRAFAKFR